MKATPILRFRADSRAATAMEYALLAAGIGISIVFVVGSIGEDVLTMYTEVLDGFLRTR